MTARDVAILPATSDLFQNTLPQWCCIARHFESQELFQDVIMGFWAP